MKFNIKEFENYTFLEFELSEPITPEQLPNIQIPKINLTKGVIISGRGPIWLHSFLAHHFHPSMFVAHFDPRLGGAVIVQSHSPLPEFKESKVIKIE